MAHTQHKLAWREYNAGQPPIEATQIVMALNHPEYGTGYQRCFVKWSTALTTWVVVDEKGAHQTWETLGDTNPGPLHWLPLQAPHTVYVELENAEQ